MKPIKQTERRVANVRNAEFTEFVSNGKPDGEGLQLGREKPFGVGFYVYRMAPGTTTQPHTHKGPEEFYIIEGDLTDNDGTEYGPGDLVWLADGTQHCSTTKNGCLIVVYTHEPDGAVSA
ncbi:cupin domain-containing protein [Roseovarius sp. SCSIO 43702]|uniref:cupin domain-containing protein n=1 Tax=Roseovarius sp. SCSIO 43702 TaxID=2823043 RepID=UPI001C734DC3|nr:cupin domain-containing protein [Roseovarius sp. SCSIO 43702]QYX57528.1 cupin domain-containing protein [Roseovarius sp. SCSIO 43702]